MPVVIAVPYGGEDPQNVPGASGHHWISMGFRVEPEARCWCGTLQDLAPVTDGFRCRLHQVTRQGSNRADLRSDSEAMPDPEPVEG